MLEDLTDSIIDWADGFGLLGLAIVSATEAAFHHAQPDLIVLQKDLGAASSMEKMKKGQLISVVAVVPILLNGG